MTRHYRGTEVEDDPVKRIEKMKEVRGFMFTTEDIAGLKALSLCAKPNNIDFFAVTEDSIDYLKTLSTSLNAGVHHPMDDFEIMSLLSVLLGCWFSSETLDNMPDAEFEAVDKLIEKLSAIIKARRDESIH